MTSSPAPFEALDAYQSGDMSDAEAAGFEQELFASAAGGGEIGRASCRERVFVGV